MSNKQSSVEWFAEIVSKIGYVSTDILEQAKAMHKEENRESFEKGYKSGIVDYMDIQKGYDGRAIDFEQYYKETFEGSNK